MPERDPQVKTSKNGKETYAFELGYLPEFFQKKAEVELQETPEKILQCTRQLKQMIKCDPKLHHFDIDDDGFLLQCLRVRKYRVEEALHRIKECVRFSTRYPETVSPYSYEETKRTVQDRIINVLPWRCHEGCAVILFELDHWRPDTFSVDALKRLISLTLFQSLREPMTQVNGFKVIFDVKSTSLRYLRHCTPQNLYSLYYGPLECIPGRFKGIHVVNDSMTFKAAWLLVKNFLSHKLKQRIHFHSSPKTLFDYFPRDIMPTQFGGNLESYDQTAWLKNAMTPEAIASIAGGIFKHL